MKPRIVLLLLIVTLATMVVAEGGLPSASLVVFTLLGGGLAAGAGNAINCYFDRDIDALMTRTRGRPIPALRLESRHALVFGLVLTVISFALLAFFVNWWAAFIALGAILFYTMVYTVWLKRTTPQNIVIGGAAGAVPPLVGWVAVRGELDAAALVLFAIIFYWTPPHFWALALLRSGDYRKAGVPMLPLIVGEAGAKRHILLYAVLLAAVSLLLIPVNAMGLLYLGAALLLGAIFVALAVRLYLDRTVAAARGLFMFSTSYLGLLFASMVADKMLF
jgi:protoheme IX farnesyltransferase